MRELKANEDMVQGFLDGYDLDNPEPNSNRSRSYRHGFANGRDDRRGKPRASYDTITAWAEEAMRLDGENTLGDHGQKTGTD